MTDRNNPRTLEGIREKIRAIASAPSLAQAQYDHAYRVGWIGALYWADLIDRETHDQLLAEIADALQRWSATPSQGVDPARQAALIEVEDAKRRS